MLPLLLGFAVGYTLASLLTPYSGAQVRSLLRTPGAPPAQGAPPPGEGHPADPLAVLQERVQEFVAAARQGYAEALTEARDRYQRMLQEPGGRPGKAP